MISLDNYMNFTQKPKEYYQGLNQATINKMFEDTTQLYTIKEQKALPFINEYEDIDVWIDYVSETLVNTSKVYSDFLELFFKDCKRKQNYKGQYYKINLDNEHEEYYICYDRINKLQQVATTKVVRCNNVLTYQDEQGNIITMPCYLGADISSTNNQVSKDATIPNTRLIILIQSNDYTMNIRNNQRFMFQHSTCFKVEEVNNYMQEQGTNGEVTCVKIYVDYSTLLPTDNIELNICDYYSNIEEDKKEEDITKNKRLVVSNENLSIKQGKYKEITCDIYNGDKKIDGVISYTTSGANKDSYTISINDGVYRITNNRADDNILLLTFSSDGCDDVTVNIELKGVV